MGTLIKQELYKLTHKKGTWFAAGFMVLVQIGFALLRLKYPKLMSVGSLFGSDYIGGQLVLFIMIASCASMFAMEFQYGTIKQLLCRQYYRSQVFVSKLIVLLLQLACLQALASAVTFLLTVILFPKFDLQATALNGTNIHQYALTLSGRLLVAVLLLSVVVLLATLFKSNAMAIATGYIGYFVLTVAASMLSLLIAHWEWVKWNPFTMLLVGDQISQPKLYHQLTHLDTPVMIACTLGYTVLFTLVAYLSFRKHSV